MITTIHNSDDVAQLMNHTGVSLLVVCMDSHETYHEQMDIVMAVADEFFPALKVCLVAEEFITSFCRNYQVKGTPTILVFAGGDEKDRMIGFTERNRLIECMNRTFLNVRTGII